MDKLIQSIIKNKRQMRAAQLLRRALPEAERQILKAFWANGRKMLERRLRALEERRRSDGLNVALEIVEDEPLNGSFQLRLRPKQKSPQIPFMFSFNSYSTDKVFRLEWVVESPNLRSSDKLRRCLDRVGAAEGRYCWLSYELINADECVDDVVLEHDFWSRRFFNEGYERFLAIHRAASEYLNGQIPR